MNSKIPFPSATINQSMLLKSIAEHVQDGAQQPLVIISCLTYNHEPYIKEAIESFLLQKTSFPVKIVIFEDCSTDKTAAILHEYQSQYPNLFEVFYMQQNTYGQPNRRMLKKPFDEARSRAKYTAHCEGDDYWTDTLKLQKQVDFLETNSQYSLCVSGFQSLHMDTKATQSIIKAIKSNEPPYNGFSFTLEDTQQQWLTKNLTAVYRNNKEFASLFQHYHYSRDIHTFYHILKTGKGFYFTEAMGVYRIHEGGVNSMKPKYINNIFAYNAYKELYLVNKDEWTRAMYFVHTISLFRFNLYHSYPNHSWRKTISLYIEAAKAARTIKDYRILISSFLPRFKQVTK